jgi:predicted membrane protein
MDSTMNATPEQSSGKSSRMEWRKLLLNYQWIVKNIPFFLFLCVLAVVYIYNGHYAEKTIKDINRNARELKEMQYEYKTVKSELMFQSKQSEIVKAVEPLGLHELTQPPYRLADSATTLKKQ